MTHVRRMDGDGVLVYIQVSELYAYMPLEAKDQDLKALEGSYYSKELDCTTYSNCT